MTVVPPFEASARREHLGSVLLYPPADAVWQISPGVMDVPTASQNVNLGEALARLLGHEPAGRQVYTESFSTEMGLGMANIVELTAGKSPFFEEPDSDEGGASS